MGIQIQKVTRNGVEIALAEADAGEVLMADAQSALELAVTAYQQHGARRLAVPAAALPRAFFTLSTGLAGEILQKLVNYRFKIAIYGDFSPYGGKPLRDFMWESNRGRDVFFVPTAEEAVERLGK